jgi:hypothetical protein
MQFENFRNVSGIDALDLPDRSNVLVYIGYEQQFDCALHRILFCTTLNGCGIGPANQPQLPMDHIAIHMEWILFAHSIKDAVPEISVPLVWQRNLHGFPWKCGAMGSL